MSRENSRSVPTGGNSCLPQYPRDSHLSRFDFEPLKRRTPWRILPIPPAPALLDEFLIDIPIGQQPTVERWGQTRHLVWICVVNFPMALPFLPINLLIGASFSAC